MTRAIFTLVGDRDVARGLGLVELHIVPRDAADFSVDRWTKTFRGNLALLGVSREPARALLVGDRQRQRAVPELRQVLGDPSVSREHSAQPPDARGVDELEIDRVTIELREEVAEVQVAVM